MIAFISVSYTHLDVYKRQIVNNATEKLSLFELSEKGGEYRCEKEGEEVKQLAKN